MATRSTVKIDGINLYSHWDGYPMGMAAKLYMAIDKLYTFEFNRSKKVPFLNAFIAGNSDNCEINLEKNIDGTEYAYRIDSKSMKIKAFVVSLETKERSVIFDGTIFDFIEKYHKDKQSFLEGKEAIYLVETKKCDNNIDFEYFTEKTMTQEVENIVKNIERFSDTNQIKKIYQNRLSLMIDAKVIKGA